MRFIVTADSVWLTTEDSEKIVYPLTQTPPTPPQVGRISKIVTFFFFHWSYSFRIFFASVKYSWYSSIFSSGGAGDGDSFTQINLAIVSAYITSIHENMIKRIDLKAVVSVVMSLYMTYFYLKYLNGVNWCAFFEYSAT